MLRTKAEVLTTWLLKAHFRLNAMRHFWLQSSGSVDLNHAALGRQRWSSRATSFRWRRAPTDRSCSSIKISFLRAVANVSFGSKADPARVSRDVRFTPEADITGRERDVR
jgi:hypothetical protein